MKEPNQYPGLDRPITYQINVKSHIDEQWSERLEGLAVTYDKHDNTVLIGSLVDQADLLSLLNEIHALNLTLISVTRLENNGIRSSTQEKEEKQIMDRKFYFAYFYFMKNEPEKIQSIAPSHVAYWKGLKLKGYLGGPFADRSGGLITFEAESLETASNLIMNDPFVVEDLLENKWIKEWIVE